MLLTVFTSNISLAVDAATKQGGKPLISIWHGFGQSVPSCPSIQRKPNHSFSKLNQPIKNKYGLFSD
jgi:hypothetical protein